MTPLSSALYSGRVRHTRLRPIHHDFEYRVYYMLFDIDELDRLDRGLRLLSVDRFNLFTFNRADHGPTDGSKLRPWAERVLRTAGIDLRGGRIELLAFPRLLGYAFNPLSVWYCFGPDGELAAVLHEVRNTFGDRHTYVVPIGPAGLRHSFDKELHVSPFNDMDQSYQFTISKPAQRLAVGIEQRDRDGTLFRAGLRLTRYPLTDRNLLRFFFSHPLLSIKVIGGIHWQALRLWLKGAKFHSRPEPPANSITVVNGETVAA